MAPTPDPMPLARIIALRAYQVFSNVLFDPITAAWRIIEAPAYAANLVRYWHAQRRASSEFRIKLRYLYPVLGDRHRGAGTASGHYFHQDVWAAREIYRRGPVRHVDVGSSVAGFVAHLLSFREVEYVDIRPLRTNVSDLRYRKGDITALPYPDDSVESLSALHVIEHIGLGRYGDPIDTEGWRKAAAELGRVLSPGGHLYFSVPIGSQRLEFDSQRVFAPLTIVEALRPLVLDRFAYINDDGDYAGDIEPARFRGWFSCGLFIFTKR